MVNLITLVCSLLLIGVSAYQQDSIRSSHLRGPTRSSPSVLSPVDDWMQSLRQSQTRALRPSVDPIQETETQLHRIPESDFGLLEYYLPFDPVETTMLQLVRCDEYPEWVGSYPILVSNDQYLVLPFSRSVTQVVNTMVTVRLTRESEKPNHARRQLAAPDTVAEFIECHPLDYDPEALSAFDPDLSTRAVLNTLIGSQLVIVDYPGHEFRSQGTQLFWWDGYLAIDHADQRELIGVHPIVATTTDRLFIQVDGLDPTSVEAVIGTVRQAFLQEVMWSTIVFMGHLEVEPSQGPLVSVTNLVNGTVGDALPIMLTHVEQSTTLSDDVDMTDDISGLRGLMLGFDQVGTDFSGFLPTVPTSGVDMNTYMAWFRYPTSEELTSGQQICYGKLNINSYTDDWTLRYSHSGWHMRNCLTQTGAWVEILAVDTPGWHGVEELTFYRDLLVGKRFLMLDSAVEIGQPTVTWYDLEICIRHRFTSTLHLTYLEVEGPGETGQLECTFES